MKKLILIPIILLLTGCWNYNELNNLAICTGIAIDKNENNYEISFYHHYICCNKIDNNKCWQG